MNEFEFSEDRDFFKGYLMTDPKEDFEIYMSLFDFRPNEIKRKEFNRTRDKLFADLEKLHGHTCMLNLEICDPEAKLVIDHIIPLTTNKLNKELRQLKAEPGKKVKSQNFGSNHINNLILACEKCNNNKKHRLLDRGKLQEILMKKQLSNKNNIISYFVVCL